VKRKAKLLRRNNADARRAPAQLWLVRHAHALDGDDDAVRPLSAKGRAQVKRLAEFLRVSGSFAPAKLWHSPLVRARQTADLQAEKLQLIAPLCGVASLAPGNSPQAIARRLARMARPLALVGHEPHLSTLASLLVVGAAEPPVFELKKCSVLALERATDRWVVRWQVSPELLA
jgi:phosphohistidine phosphatase